MAQYVMMSMPDAESVEWLEQKEARQAKSRARLARFEEMSSFEHQKRNKTQEIFIPVGECFGDKVIEFKGVGKAMRRTTQNPRVR
jgi:sulfate-transporting ATPase